MIIFQNKAQLTSSYTFLKLTFPNSSGQIESPFTLFQKVSVFLLLRFCLCQFLCSGLPPVPNPLSPIKSYSSFKFSHKFFFYKLFPEYSSPYLCFPALNSHTTLMSVLLIWQSVIHCLVTSLKIVIYLEYCHLTISLCIFCLPQLPKNITVVRSSNTFFFQLSIEQNWAPSRNSLLNVY